MRISICYSHVIELLPSAYKSNAATALNMIDMSTIFIGGIFLMFLPDVILWQNITFGIGIFAIILYFWLIPESPRWLFTRDFNSKEGIKILNYISWFNRSKYIIPREAVLDVVGQLLQETETIYGQN